MERIKIANFVERVGLLLGGAFIGLGAHTRGWINYTSDWEFWLLPVVLLFLIAGGLRTRDRKRTAGSKPYLT